MRNEQLVELARGGDELAFRELVRRHAGPLFAVAHRLVGEESAAEDVVQESFLRAWRSLARFDGRSAVGTWLHRIAVNCALDHLRRERRMGEEVAVGEPHAADDGARGLTVTLPAGDPDPERRTLSGEIAAVVERTLPLLSALERTAFVLRHFEGKTTEEIASALGVNAQAGKHAVFRAVQKFRAALAPLVGARGPRGPAAPAAPAGGASRSGEPARPARSTAGGEGGLPGLARPASLARAPVRGPVRDPAWDVAADPLEREPTSWSAAQARARLSASARGVVAGLRMGLAERS